MNKKYYVVWKGLKTGIFDNWDECKEAVLFVRNADYMVVPSLQEAQHAIRFLSRKEYEQFLTQNALPINRFLKSAPISNSYCVDAACRSNPGPVEYRCVHTTTRQLIFHQGPFENGTNNIGEFLAIVHALALFVKKGIDEPIYSDSEIALQWVKEKKCNTKLAVSSNNVYLFELIRRAEEWLKKMDAPIRC